MEIEVTRIVKEWDCSEFSSSVAESGCENIGQITWEAACEAVRYATRGGKKFLVSAEDQEELRANFVSRGWEEADIAAMSDVEAEALLLQDISAEVQEFRHLGLIEGDAERQRLADLGHICPNLYKGDDGRWYFYVGE